MIWQTAAEPWHVLHVSRATIISGDVATFGGGSGWVFQLDLKTGLPIRETKLGMGTITSLVDLGDGRILVVGFASKDFDALPTAFTLDATTLAPTPIKLPTRNARTSYLMPTAALVADGGVAISGANLPLSIYDPKTWAVRTTLDTNLGWGKLASRGEILLAERSSLVRRFNTATNGQRELQRGVSSHLVPIDGADIMRVARNSKWIAELHLEDKTVVPLNEDIDAVVAYDGKRFITTKRSELRIHELRGGEIKKRIAIDDTSVYLSGLVVGGKRGVAAFGGIIRVIDLETGAITPKQPGSRQGVWLAVGNDGSVLAGNEPTVWTMANGKVAGSEALGKDVELSMIRSDDPTRFITTQAIEQVTTVGLHTVGNKAARTVTVEGEVKATWLGRDGSLVLQVEEGEAEKIMRARTTTAETVVVYNRRAEVIAVDPDGEMLVALDGRVAVVGQDGKLKSTIRMPHCEDTLMFGVAEPGGSRAITYDHKDFALWDRKTGKLIANVKVDSPEDILFIPKREEVLIVLDDRIVVWTPTKGTRTVRHVGVLEPAISADGKKLALSFYDGRIGVHDLDALIAAAPLEADLPAGDPIAATCGEDDPLALPDVESAGDSDGGDDDVWGGD